MSIAWIGLGNMGGPMAANLVRAGHHVTGFDLNPAALEAAAAAGIEVAASVAEAVLSAEIVFTMLPKGEHVRSVLQGPEGILASVAPGTLIVDSSTIDIDSARQFHEQVSAAGFRFLDAPVSGGVFGAVAGTLTFMIGGADDDLAQARPFLDVMAGRVFHTGGAGNGQAAKIVNNMMLGITLAATCEGAVLAERLGLDAATFRTLASSSSGDSWPLRTWYPVPGVVETAAVNRDFEGGFATVLMHKDLSLALAAGESTHTPLDFAIAAHGRMAALIEAGYGDKDCSILVRQVDGTIQI
ncbi:3-hydroxyisobutyrate dehydrogenase [Nakamurella antarctica]|uniref:3-hydroxyisobutyrate dehydrogenase n=1 Tax=Nakamurella antarctica TaxID=1902245 RepID=A0A3G8ZVP2_9ACTN|nr:3-hydroxyisobutyrate dehydrogenase [Nakamurella antarctica]AZI57741.1 3-hydroxyisobutyrate dehydrogenase [Nakamurella antarctica]